MKIRIITSDKGHGGELGEIVEVSQERATRYCSRGLAELVLDEAPKFASDEAPKEKKPKK